MEALARDLGERAVRVDLPHAGARVEEIDHALPVNDDAGAGVGEGGAREETREGESEN